MSRQILRKLTLFCFGKFFPAAQPMYNLCSQGDCIYDNPIILACALHLSVRNQSLCVSFIEETTLLTDSCLLPVGGRSQGDQSFLAQACHVPEKLDSGSCYLLRLWVSQKPELQVTNIPSACQSKSQILNPQMSGLLIFKWFLLYSMCNDLLVSGQT